MAFRTGAATDVGAWVMVVGAAGGLIDSLFNFFWPGNGIHGSWGALAVIILSVLIGGAALLLALGLSRMRWLRIVFDALLFIGIVVTGFLAWMLEALALVGLMAFSLLGWLIHVIGRPRELRVARAMPQGAAE
ncbi:MAG TPA: hypothetical protein VFW75_01205 [Acetobacteraceae bacterium]|nr:hypothetical protein [Acetobacteraceae bacterium]